MIHWEAIVIGGIIAAIIIVLHERLRPDERSDHLPTCDDFAPDALGENPDVCIACLWHRLDHERTGT